MEPRFTVTAFDFDLIGRIATRAVQLAAEAGTTYNRTQAMMDLCATQNTCPLDLEALAQADNLNFAHDVFGIRRHLNRATGELENCFRPRYARS